MILYFTDCNNPIAPRNGTTTLTIAGLTTYESTARVSCNHGYTLSGNATMVCRADGLWSLNAECIIKGAFSI